MRYFLAFTLSVLTATFATAQVPRVDNVTVVVLENSNYSQVIGNFNDMPYLNALASNYAQGGNYFADTHPSIGNYFMMTTGQIVTNDDGFDGQVDVDNLVRQLNVSGLGWKSYAESVPYAGYLGDDAYPYARRHNPVAYLTDVVNDPAQAANIVPFDNFGADLQSGSLPNFALVIPNLLNDAHDGSLSDADNWLAANIDPLIQSPSFQRSGLLIIVFDEADNDNSNGGGHVAMVMVSPQAVSGYVSPTFYQHENLLRTISDALGVNPPGAAANAAQMADFFTF